MLEQLAAPIYDIPPLLYVMVALVGVWYLKTKTRPPDNIPPFPVTPYPILGHIPMMAKDSLNTLKDWHKSTGDVYSMYLGQTLVVVLNSFQVVREALVKQADHFSDRPHRFIDTDDRFAGGVVDTSGPLWREQRAVTVAILKKFGMGKNWMGDKINIEVEAYLDSLAKTKGQPTNVRSLTNACVSNVICTILIGNRFQLDDPYFLKFFELLQQQNVYLQNTSILKVFPWLKYLPGDMFNAKKLLNNEETFRTEFGLKYINKMKENNNLGSEQNFIDSYLMEEKERNSEKTTLNEKNLSLVMTNLLQAGTETTSTTIMWALLFVLHNPGVQEKLHQEIDEWIGTDRLADTEEKNKMKYVNAFIMETQRLGSIIPLSLPHVCSKRTKVGGYTIPEGTMILPHLNAILHDTQTWGDPMVFRPERFIQDGSLVVPEQFIPFSIGRRFCLGDNLAKTELFLFLTGIFQQFHIQPEDPDNLPSLEPVMGISCTTQPYKLRFIPRKQQAV